MTIGSASSLDRQGKLLVAYSNDDGSTIGVEFAATTQKAATAVFGICASTFGESTGRLVSTAASSDTLMNSTDGGDNMETRIAVLEADVAHIKNDIASIKEDTRKISSDATDAKRDTAVLLQKSVDFDSSLSKKPSVDYFEAKFASIETKISDVKTWMLGVLLISFAMPTIFFLINLYLKKG
ncbi:Uncharacterised protein [Serratia entomophila]|nr:hypothetical protein [Serratia entomophila]CAI1926338.1 Uncharacterised protein [Serratia entomophila]